MSKFFATRLVPAGLLLAFLVAAVFGPAPFTASASSQREAPLIASDPQADITDVYAFVSPDRQDSVTLIADWIPFEVPYSGPTYFRFADEVLYEMHVDTIGDAKSHVTYQFKFTTHTRYPDTFLYNIGPIGTITDTNWNVYQTYTVTEIFSNPPFMTTTVLAGDLTSPPVNIGSKSTPNYDTLGDAGVCTIGINVLGNPTGTTCNTRGTPLGGGNNNIKVFAGQRDDPFFVDLQLFDLLTLRGQAPPIGYTNGHNLPLDGLKGFNVHGIALQIPISRLIGPNSPTGNNPNPPIIGVWATSSRPMTSTFSAGSVTYTGPMVQISRLGMPLTNEVVMPLALKDGFNGRAPAGDLPLYTSGTGAGPLLEKSVQDPELGRRLCGLYGVQLLPLPRHSGSNCTTDYTPLAPWPGNGRTDIFDIFLTGMTTAITFTINTANGPVQLAPPFDINQPMGVGVVPAEMLRLNTGIKGAFWCSPTPSRLGILGGDACGFPNGRRLADDVTDIELLAVGGAAWRLLVDNSFSFNPALLGTLTDRVNQNDVPFGTTFPYVASPHAGQDAQFANVFSSYFSVLWR